MKRVVKLFALWVAVLAMVSCQGEPKKQEETPDEKVQKIITSWIENRKAEYPSYSPIEFGKLTPRYRFNSRTHKIMTTLDEELEKEHPNKALVDSLQRLLNENKSDLLGYTIVHRFTTEALNGVKTEEEKLFFLDSLYRIVTVLNADSWDLIMDKELFFNPESPDSIGQ